MHCTIWDHFSNLKNVKNTHGGVLLLMNLQVYPPWVFFSLFKLYKRYHIAQRITNYVYCHTDFCYALLTAKQSCYNKIYCKANRLLRSRESARDIFARQLSDLILSNKRVQLSN